MNKKEIIERVCALLSKVNAEHFMWSHASDCFCDYKEYDGYRMDEEVIKFIEQAVESAIKTKKNYSQESVKSFIVQNLMYEEFDDNLCETFVDVNEPTLKHLKELQLLVDKDIKILEELK